MSIFVRPVREQLEHDRLIRFLAGKYRRKFEVATNVGDEQAAPLKLGAATFFPDLILTSNKKLTGIVEVETGESINNLEAMAQWTHFGQAKAPFHLYVPVTMFDVARRLCEAQNIRVAELWSYRGLSDGFDLVRSFHDPSAASVSGAPAPAAAKKPAAPKTPVPSKPAAAAKAPAPAKAPAAAKPAKKAPVKKAVAKKPAKKAPKKKAKR